MDSERQRLARLYASLSEGEIEKLAHEAMSLSDDARAALSDEIRRRRLDLELAAPPPYTEVEHLDLVQIRQFRDMPEALLAKGALESAGIEVFLVDENMVRLDWFISNLLGGVKLAVKREDVEAARSVLDEPIPETFESDGGEFTQPRCPRCNSLRIAQTGPIDKSVALTGLYFSIPTALRREVWKCDACGAEWREEAGEEEKPPEASEPER